MLGLTGSGQSLSMPKIYLITLLRDFAWMLQADDLKMKTQEAFAGRG